MLTYTDTVTSGVYTLNEFIAALDGPPVNASNAEELAAHRANRDFGWMGLAEEVQGNETALTATLRLIRDGYRTGIKLMEEVANEISAPAPKVIRRQQRWRDQGDDVEMQRIWAGDLDHAFRGTVRDYRSGPQRVRLLIDAIESGGNGAEGMRWRGVTALKLSDLLTEAGYAVQIESVISCKDSSNTSKTFRLSTIVKQYEQPVDLLTLAATTALPSYFRSLMHLWGLKVSKHFRNMGVSYQVRTPEAEEFADGDPNVATFIISRFISNAERAGERITEIIKELDGEEE